MNLTRFLSKLHILWNRELTAEKMRDLSKVPQPVTGKE